MRSRGSLKRQATDFFIWVVSYGLPAMLEPVALHQTGFKVPGLALDARDCRRYASGSPAAWDRPAGVVLRLLSEELQIDDVLPSLRIELVRNPLGAQAYLLRGAPTRFARPPGPRRSTTPGTVLCIASPASTSYRTRDRRAPLGYDASELHLLETGSGPRARAGRRRRRPRMSFIRRRRRSRSSRVRGGCAPPQLFVPACLLPTQAGLRRRCTR